MKKKIYTVLYLIFYLSTINADNYVIKLASYTNKNNLDIQLQKLDLSLRKNTRILYENKLYKLYTKIPYDKNTTLRLLPFYQKIFPDAFLKEVNVIEDNNTGIQLTTAIKNELNISLKAPETSIQIKPSCSLMNPIPIQEKRYTFHELLVNKIYYLCPNKIHTPSEKLLLKAHFTNSNVEFTTIIGNVPALTMPYTIQSNRLYFIQNGRISPSQYNTIDKIYFDYILFSRWMKGKKIHKMRYYKKEEDAKSYLNAMTFK